MESITKESERSLAEVQILYGAHVFARAKIVPDLAILKAEEAHGKAVLMGDRLIEFLAAGGAAMAYLDLGELEPAETWLNRASATASEAPTPFRARLLEAWRGLWRAAAGDAEGMRRHLERALQLATEQGRPAARCEALAQLAVEAARMGVARDDHELIALAERSAEEAKTIVDLLPGQPPWGAQADAAQARIALARGEVEKAVAASRSAFETLQASYQEDAHLEVFLPVAEALLAGGTGEEQQMARMFLRVTLAMAAQRTADQDVRVRWLRGPWGRQLVKLAGPLDERALRPAGDGAPALADADAELLALLVEGLTNREIAERLGIEEVEVTRKLGAMLGRIGASSRAEATAFAFREGVV
jgi:DNA-binding NarL/FixJ family response regulator